MTWCTWKYHCRCVHVRGSISCVPAVRSADALGTTYLLLTGDNLRAFSAVCIGISCPQTHAVLPPGLRHRFLSCSWIVKVVAFVQRGISVRLRSAFRTIGPAQQEPPYRREQTVRLPAVLYWNTRCTHLSTEPPPSLGEPCVAAAIGSLLLIFKTGAMFTWNATPYSRNTVLRTCTPPPAVLFVLDAGTSPL